MINEKNNNKFVCAITGPTYAGKTTLSKKLISEFDLLFPPQTTTRNKRLDDQEKKYKYLSVEDFNLLKERDEFIISSGADNMQYGILKEDIDNCFSKNDGILINISYENFYQYNMLEYQKALLILTYRDIENGILNRVRLSDRKMSAIEIEKRIEIAKFLHSLYFDDIKNISDCVIYTDESNEIETFEIAKKVLKKKLER